MEEIHLTKKDFKLEWYSGQGAGGQHRNKHQNCCRITHKDSGITINGTASRSRVENQRTAFTKLAQLVILWYRNQEHKDPKISEEVIRNYHAVRNEVHDKESGLKMSYKEIVSDGNIEPMVKARRTAKGGSNE